MITVSQHAFFLARLTASIVRAQRDNEQSLLELARKLGRAEGIGPNNWMMPEAVRAELRGIGLAIIKADLDRAERREPATGDPRALFAALVQPDVPLPKPVLEMLDLFDKTFDPASPDPGTLADVKIIAFLTTVICAAELGWMPSAMAADILGKSTDAIEKATSLDDLKTMEPFATMLGRSKP
jgi:hypothetical protein